jgi:hypothetical protein
MAILTTFLRGITEAGRLMLREPPPTGPEPEATALLAEAYAIHTLGVGSLPARQSKRSSWFCSNSGAT